MFSRFRPALLVGLAVVSLLALVGCGRKPAAVVNGQRISRDRYYGALEHAAGAPVLVQLIAEEIILGEAAKQKVMPTDAQIAKDLAQLKKVNPAAVQGLSDGDAKRQMSVRLAVKNLAFKGLTVTEADIKKFYEANKKQFDRPEMVMAKRAVFKTQPEAEVARGTLLKANVQFSVILGKSIDLDNIKQNGGAIPPLVKDPKQGVVMLVEHEGSLHAQPPAILLGEGVAEKVFSLPAKGITDVLRSPTPEGYQVIQIHEHQQAKTGAYTEWKERIQEELMLQKYLKGKKLPQGTDPMAFLQAQLVEQLRPKAQIEVNVERFKDLPQHPEAWPQVSGALR